MGVPVRQSKLGIPITLVDTGAPLITEAKLGIPVTIVQKGGAPFVLEGNGTNGIANKK